MNRHRLLLVMSACFACIALDNAKLVAALPSLARISGASPALQRWTVEASLVVYASLLLLGVLFALLVALELRDCRFGVAP